MKEVFILITYKDNPKPELFRLQYETSRRPSKMWIKNHFFSEKITHILFINPQIPTIVTP